MFPDNDPSIRGDATGRMLDPESKNLSNVALPAARKPAQPADGNTQLSSIQVSDDDAAPRDPFETVSMNPAATSTPGTAVPSEQQIGKPRFPQLPGYEVLEHIAQGGMGVVYRARDLTLQRPVAIKVPRAGIINSPEDKERFLREARAAARLRHPHICPIYDVREVAGEPCICMAFIEGPTLKQWVQQQQSGPRQIADLVATLATAVQFAHDQGVLHRDLKPANVLVEASNGQPYLMDFGLAKDLGQEEGLTASGAVLGTPAYMAPEQAGGRTEQIGKLSDVYALGVILYELLSGAPPFRGTVAEILVKVQSQEPVSLRKVSAQIHPDLEIICQKAMAKLPAERYATAAELAADLHRFVRGEPIAAKRQPWHRRVARIIGKNRVVASLLVTLLLVLAGLLFSVPWLDKQARFSSVSTQFQLLLKQKDWPAAGQLLPELAKISPVEARKSRGVLVGTLNEYVEKQIRRGKLTTSDIAAIERDISVLRGVNIALANERTRQLETQLGLWERVVTLENDFAGVEKTLPGVRVKEDGSALLGPPNWIDPDFRPKSVFLTPETIDGNIELEARVQLPKKCVVGFIIAATKRHEACVTAIAVSPSGEHFVSADALGNLRLFQTAGGDDLGPLPDHKGAIGGLAFSPDGQWLASSGCDGEVHILDFATKKISQTWRIEVPRVEQLGSQAMFFGPPLAFNADGTQLLVGSGDGQASGEIRRWKFPSGNSLPALRSAQPTPFIVQLSTSTNDRVAAATWDNRVQLWDLAMTKQTFDYALHPPGHPPNLPALALNPAGNVVAAGSHGAIRLINEQGAEFALLEGYAAGVYALVFDPAGKMLAAGHEGGTIKLWDIGLRQLKHTIPDNRRRCEALAFGPHGEWLMGGVEHGTLHLWELPSGQERYVIDGKGYNFTASRAQEGPLTLQITRGTTVLRQEIIEVDSDLLKFSARREGDKLELQVNSRPPLVFHDYFPPQPLVRGRWGVVLEPFTELQQLIVRRAIVAEAVNPLQAGDRLLNEGQYADSLEAFERQESNPADDPTSQRARQEARLKAAICLLRLGREYDAADKLRGMGGGPADDPAVVMARFMLWEMLVRQEKRTEADQLFAATRIEFPAEFVAEVIPVDTRARILAIYATPLFRRTGLAQAGAIVHLQSALEMNEYFLLPELAVVDWRMTYLAALRISGQEAQAATEISRMLQLLDAEAQQGDIRLKPIEQLRSLLRRYGCLSRLRGEPQLVEGYLKVVLLDSKGELLPDVVGPRLALLLELARVHAAQQEWQRVHDCLQPLLTAADRSGIPREIVGDAVLLDGFALRHMGGEAEALAAWKQHPYPDIAGGADPGSLTAAEVLQFWMLRSLAGDLTVSEAEGIVNVIKQRLAGSGGAVSKVMELVPVQPAILQQAWQTGPGLQSAEAIALGKRLPTEIIADSMQVGAYTTFAHGAFAGPPTPEQEAIVWKQTQLAFRSFSNDEISFITLSLMGLAWKGTPPPFTTWENFLKQLPEVTRPGAAYVLGRRFAHRGRPADARTLFGLARDWAAGDATLKQLAEEELAKLPP